MKNPTVRWTVGVIAAIVLLALLRFKPWQKPITHEDETLTTEWRSAPQTLTVAFIPVTCHLTCPITDFASKTSTTGTRFDAMRFTEFPSMTIRSSPRSWRRAS